MVESKLVGYIRKSRDDTTIRMSIDAQAFAEAERFSSRDGREFVQLVANIPKIEEIISGDREVTSICQLVDE